MSIKERVGTQPIDTAAHNKLRKQMRKLNAKSRDIQRDMDRIAKELERKAHLEETGDEAYDFAFWMCGDIE